MPTEVGVPSGTGRCGRLDEVADGSPHSLPFADDEVGDPALSSDCGKDRRTYLSNPLFKVREEEIMYPNLHYVKRDSWSI